MSLITIKQYDIFQNEDCIPYLKEINKYVFPEEYYEVREEDNDNVKWTIAMLLGELEIDCYSSEHMYVVAYNDDHSILGIHLLSIGNDAVCALDERNLAMFLALSGAREFIIVHNHPNDSVALSDKDISVAKIAENIGKTLGCRMLDFIAVASNSYSGLPKELKPKKRKSFANVKSKSI